MSWQIRREGSPTITGGLTAQQILEGVHEGVWDLGDEVRGPKDMKWTPVGSHHFFEEALEDFEPAHKHTHDFEEHLDMNPLIDVALVLLIFFILTTSYDALRKVIDLPTVAQGKGDNVKRVSEEQAKNEFIRVKAEQQDKQTLYFVDGQQVEKQHLATAIEVGVAGGKTRMIIEAFDVSWEAVIEMISAGRKARVGGKIMLRVNEPRSIADADKANNP